jgi:hypothetical protein
LKGAAGGSLDLQSSSWHSELHQHGVRPINNGKFKEFEADQDKQ